MQAVELMMLSFSPIGKANECIWNYRAKTSRDVVKGIDDNKVKLLKLLTKICGLNVVKRQGQYNAYGNMSTSNCFISVLRGTNPVPQRHQQILIWWKQMEERRQR